MRATSIAAYRRVIPLYRHVLLDFHMGPDAGTPSHFPAEPSLQPRDLCVGAAFSETLSLLYLPSVALLTFVPVTAKVLAPLEVAGMLFVFIAVCSLFSTPACPRT